MGHENGGWMNEDQRGAMRDLAARSTAPKTLANQVDDLACRAIWLEGLAGEMLAMIKLNVERGYIVAVNDEGKLNLPKIVASWEKELGPLQPGGSPQLNPAALAEKFHNLYEQLAPEYGYETRKESAVPWADVPAKNKGLMIEVCRHLLATCQELSPAELTARFYSVRRERDRLLTLIKRVAETPLMAHVEKMLPPQRDALLALREAAQGGPL